MPKKYRTAADRVRVTLNTGQESIVQQHAKDECDINNIMAKYRSTGTITHVRGGAPTFDDVSDVVSFHDAMSIITAADEAFMGLPSDLRKRYSNDPAMLLAAIDRGDDELVRQLGNLGMLTAGRHADETPSTSQPPADNKDGRSADQPPAKGARGAEDKSAEGAAAQGST